MKVHVGFFPVAGVLLCCLSIYSNSGCIRSFYLDEVLELVQGMVLSYGDVFLQE